MWDLRMDAHVLKNGYDIRLSGIIDSSLWALAYCRNRTFSFGHYRMGILSTCKELAIHIHKSELRCMEKAKRERNDLPSPAWRIRPLPTCLIDYAADVQYMGSLYDFAKKSLSEMDPSGISEIEGFTKAEFELFKAHN